MKKVWKIIIILITAILLVPIPFRLKDGGSVEYKAILYTVKDVHQINPDITKPYIEGAIIKILGWEVFNNTKASQEKLQLNPDKETVDIGERGVVKGQFGEQLEKKLIRIINVDGELYYDSGLVSDNTPRCGTLDGSLKQTVKENEIPLKSGGANFNIDGYQNATDITKDVNVDGKWVIFKKYDLYDHTLDGLKYCYYIKGHLNNAAVDSEIIVLSDYANVTFHDVYEPLLSSQATPGEYKGKILHNSIRSDKWGITLYAEDVTPKGLTLKIEQFGGNPTGSLEYGADYILETTVEDEWQPVETITGEPLNWVLIGYRLTMNDITERKIDWRNTYGKLKPGFYRLKKEFMDFRAPGDYDEETYEVYFTIE